jgi:hypothetical protein
LLGLIATVKISPSVFRCTDEAPMNPWGLAATPKVATSKFANWALCLCHIGVLGMETQLRRKSAS